MSFLAYFLLFVKTFAQPAPSSTVGASSPPLTLGSPTSPAATASSSGTVPSSSADASTSTPPDVRLNVPDLSVGRIELDVENLQAQINLAANVASLVNINAGVAVSIQTVNLTIADVEAELELIVRLNHLVDIVNRVFQSLDLNPLLISTLNNVTSALGEVVGEVDGLLGSITQGGNTISFVVDNLGNIVQQVAGVGGSTVSTIVGNYLQNMTYTGVSQTLSGGLVEKTYSYSPLNALVQIVFNAAGQVVQATVEKSGTGTASSSATSSATSSAASRVTGLLIPPSSTA